MVHLYDRRVRRLSVENPNSSDYQAALVAEKNKTELVIRELVVLKDEAKKLRAEVAKLDHHRSGLIEERDRLRAEVGAEKARYDELAVYVRSERRRLRERRVEYADYRRSMALKKMARMVQLRLNRLKAHVDDTPAAQPTFLLFNHAVGNATILKVLAESGEITIKSGTTLSNIEADIAKHKAEMKKFDVTDLMVGDFDAYTLFADKFQDLHFSSSEMSENEDGFEEHQVEQDVGQDDAGQDDAGQDDAGQDDAGQDDAGQDDRQGIADPQDDRERVAGDKEDCRQGANEAVEARESQVAVGQGAVQGEVSVVRDDQAVIVDG